jgi:uncharacterized membrane protein
MVITLAGMVSAELLLRKGMLMVGQFPQNFSEIWSFFVKAFTNFYVLGAILAAIITGLAWISTVSRADALSRVYPFMALSYVLVVVFSILFFKESVSPIRWVGVACICVGAFLVARS